MNQLITLTDQIGCSISMQSKPLRIVCLVPSITELLYTLQLQHYVVGITKFCVHPSHWLKAITIIGGTKNVQIDIVKALKPTLIIANKEENELPQIEALKSFCTVYTSNVYNLQTAYTMIEQLGLLTNTSSIASNLVQSIQSQFDNIKINTTKKVLYLIWQNPFITIGGDTFISYLLQQVGLYNVYSLQLRYPTITISDIKNIEFEYLLLSTEPYPFKQKHVAELQHILPHKNIHIINGEMCSWYGSRLLLAAEYLQAFKKNLNAQ